MKLTILVPSDEYRNYAGARIRYGRLAPQLQSLGVNLELADIASFDPVADASDVLLISKCHDARSLVAAAAAAERGRLVGVDLFDNYFSQRADSRLTRFRTWLTQLLPSCNFVLCSTPAMVEIVEGYDSSLPIHVVNDPAPDVEIQQLPQILDSKLAAAYNEQKMRIAWFGVGDNPHFRVGLKDLAAFAGTLQLLARRGIDVQLTVLTNVRALTTEGLALIAGLPLRTEIREWTEEGERELLAHSFACFLPVNAQPFSAVKSLNRAVTALSAGCQVISAGYPLYAALDDLVYRDVGAFLQDFANRTMRHSASQFRRYRERVEAIASASAEANALAQFLRGLKKPAVRGNAPLVLIQGQSPNGSAHKWIKAVGGLSVASPYCAASLNFDVLFRGSVSGVAMYVSDGAKGRLQPELRKHLETSTTLTNRKFWLVPTTDRSADRLAPADQEWQNAPLPFQIATYGPTIKCIGQRMEAAFGRCRLLLSENSQLPFSPEL